MPVRPPQPRIKPGTKRHTPWLLALVTACFPTADAIVFRTYDASRHNRFDSFPAAPTINPNQIFASVDLTGIGWQSNAPNIQYALVSRQHVVFATHWRTVLGNAPVVFLNATGTKWQRTGGTQTIIQDGGINSDLTVIKLSSPIDASTGIAPLPYLDLGGSYTGQNLGVAGKDNEAGGNFPVIGEGKISTVLNSSLELDYGGSVGIQRTRYMRFDYALNPPPPQQDADQIYFGVGAGDSGSPSFVAVGSRAALVGIHSFIDDSGDPYQNYDAFIPHYIAELDAVLAPDGYRMRPVNAPSTTLGDGSATVQATPRRALPLEFHYTLTNTGANETGNLEVEFHFNPAEAPDSLVPPAGWVSYGSGPDWTFRKALLSASADATFTANWSAAPSTDTLDPGIVRRSDTTTEAALPITIPLAPSYADWAAGLAQPGETDDPDHDRLANLLEYAFGGDPESGVLTLPNGNPLLPQANGTAGTLSVSYPEREDASLRGLTYTPEFCDDLNSWSTTPPAGLVSTTSAFDPPVPGMVKRTLTWSSADPADFVRIGVILSE